jgi:drug/metabolite transporter (DMT)-like permease
MLASAWVAATLVAATAQTARNAVQSKLTAQLGTLGATQVRFLYGLPFAALALAILVVVTDAAVPNLNQRAAVFVALGAVAQIGATALMLVAMRLRSFGVAYAYIKTEPITVAVFGLIVLGDALSPLKGVAILIATLGVLLASAKLDRWSALLTDLKPALVGVAAGALFGASAVAFRGAILALESGDFLLRAMTMLVWSLVIQSSLLAAYLLVMNRPALFGSLKVWRASLGAGALGALASMGWFTAFALTSAANVRTLALIEVVLAAVLSRRLFQQRVARQELAGMALIVLGVALLLASA